MWEGEHYTIKRTLYLIKVFIGAIDVLIDRLITNIYWQVKRGSKTLKTISQTRWTYLRELRSCKIANISVNVIGKQFSTMESKMIHIFWLLSSWDVLSKLKLVETGEVVVQCFYLLDFHPNKYNPINVFLPSTSLSQAICNPDTCFVC